MRQTAIMMAGVALLVLAVSGCSTGSFSPAPGPVTLAAPTPMAKPATLGQAAMTTTEVAVTEVAATEAESTEADSNPLAGLLAFASPQQPVPAQSAAFVPAGPSRPALDPLIAKYAGEYKVPERLIRRVIVRESGYNPGARNGPYFGLMQISHATARGMGYSGSAGGLLDADTNLRYAAKYLAGAYITARGNEDQAMRFYASGYYYDAKRAGLLEEVGLR